MPTTYEKCDESVETICKSVIDQYHLELQQTGVTVSLLFARDPESDAPVKLHGYPCAATVRVTSLKDRAKGIPDAEIVIDEMQWEMMTLAERRALLDHELYHLEVRRNEENEIDYDDLSRPKLRLKLHDAQLGIFKEIIRRHGRNALDSVIASEFISEYSPLVTADLANDREFDESNPDFTKDGDADKE